MPKFRSQDMSLHEYKNFLMTIVDMREKGELSNLDIAIRYHVTVQRVRELYQKGVLMRKRLRDCTLYQAICNHCKDMPSSCAHQMYHALVRRGYNHISALKDLDEKQLMRIRGLGKTYVGILTEIKASL